MNGLKKLTTIIMAGGKGERLFPLTRDKAKPAITFGGLYRIIDFTLSNCLNSGILIIIILLWRPEHILFGRIGLGVASACVIALSLPI